MGKPKAQKLQPEVVVDSGSVFWKNSMSVMEIRIPAGL
jgi:hypothetical protein